MPTNLQLPAIPGPLLLDWIRSSLGVQKSLNEMLRILRAQKCITPAKAEYLTVRDALRIILVLLGDEPIKQAAKTLAWVSQMRPYQFTVALYDDPNDEVPIEVLEMDPDDYTYDFAHTFELLFVNTTDNTFSPCIQEIGGGAGSRFGTLGWNLADNTLAVELCFSLDGHPPMVPMDLAQNRFVHLRRLPPTALYSLYELFAAHNPAAHITNLDGDKHAPSAR